jgi:hypothetical protein
MKRYIKSRRSRSNVVETSALRDQFIRQLTLEMDALIKQQLEQFNQALNTQVAQAFQGIVEGDNPNAPTTGQPEPGTIGSFGQLLSLGARYLVSRPRTSRSSSETSRSVENEAQFRTSRAQQLAEAQQIMARGEKNL